MSKLLKFRDARLAKRVAAHIKELAPPFQVKFCHVCGTHEWTITHYGLRSLLPENVQVIAGPGCPVCVVPAAEIDEAIQLALNGVTVATYGDLLKVPGSKQSLQDARANGGDVRVVYGVHDAIRMAKRESEKEFVFFAVGFETTAPSTAVEVLNKPSGNFSFLVAHRLIPPAMELLMGVEGLQINGFIAPGHVSTIIGVEPYRIFPEKYQMPTVVAGFEPLDVLFAVSMLLRQLKDRDAKLENEYRRVVKWKGNIRAQELMKKVFQVVEGGWRGLGRLPNSALALCQEFQKYDAHKKFGVTVKESRDLVPGCKCHLVIVGKVQPNECPLFMKACRPDKPIGPCMVSNEGTCRIWAKHMKFRR